MYKDVSKIIQLLLGYCFKYKTFFKKRKNTLTTDRIKFKIIFYFTLFLILLFKNAFLVSNHF